MVSQALDLFGQPFGIERLDGLHDPGMECAPVVVEDAPVGDLVGEGVLERVFEVRGDARLIQELGRLEVGEPAAKAVLERAKQSNRTLTESEVAQIVREVRS